MQVPVRQTLAHLALQIFVFIPGTEPGAFVLRIVGLAICRAESLQLDENIEKFLQL